MSIRYLLPQPDQTATECLLSESQPSCESLDDGGKSQRQCDESSDDQQVINVLHFDLSGLQTLQLHKKEQLDLRSFNYWGTNRPRLCTRFIFFPRV